MANYYNYLTRNGRPAKAVLVRLVNKSGQIVDTDTTDNSGYYEFLDVPQGAYDIRFYGNQLTSEDWLYDVQLVDADDINTDTLSGLAILPSIVPSQYYVRNTTGTIDLEAFLTKNVVIVDIADIDGYTWLVDGNFFGFSGLNQNTAQITAAQISGISRVSCDILYAGVNYTAYVGLTDILDGDDGTDGEDGAPGPPGPAGEGTYAVNMITDSGVIFRSDDGATYVPGSINATTLFYKAGSQITGQGNDTVSYKWQVNASHVYSGFGDAYSQFEVSPAMVSGTAHLTCDVQSGVDGPFRAEQTITDVQDGVSFVPVVNYSGEKDTILTDDLGGIEPVFLSVEANLFKEGALVDPSLISYYWTYGNGNFISSGVGSNYKTLTQATAVVAVLSDVVARTWQPNTQEKISVVQTYLPTSNVYSGSVFGYLDLVTQDSYSAQIVTNAGQIFYRDQFGSATPTSITLSGLLFKGAVEVDYADASFVWKKDGTSLPGQTNQTLSISESDVSSVANYSVEIAHAVTDVVGTGRVRGPFKDSITITDVQDGIDAVYVALSTNSGVSFIDDGGYTPTEIILSGQLYVGGSVVSSDVAYQWKQDGDFLIGESNSTLSVIPDDITSNSSRFECVIEWPVSGTSDFYNGEISLFKIGTGSPGAPGDPGADAYYAVADLSGSPILSQINGPTSINITISMYQGESRLDDSLVTYTWYIDNVLQDGSGNSNNWSDLSFVTVGLDDINATSMVRCTCQYNGTIFRSAYIPMQDLSDSIDEYIIPVRVGGSGQGLVNFDISEQFNHYGFSAFGRGILDLNNVMSSQGVIKSALLEYAEHDSSDYQEIANYYFNIASGVLPSASFDLAFDGIPVTSPNEAISVKYDFRLSFYNAYGDLAKIWDGSGFNDDYVENNNGGLGFTFIGQNFFRYSVPGLTVYSYNSVNENASYTVSPNERDYVKLSESVVRLEWLDVTTRTNELTSLALGGDYLEDWDGNALSDGGSPSGLSFSTMQNVSSYVVMAKIYRDDGGEFTGTNTSTGIANDGPGQQSSSTNASWRVLSVLTPGSPDLISDGNKLSTTLVLPYGRILSLHVYMLVDKASVFVDTGAGPGPMKYDISDNEYPEG